MRASLIALSLLLASQAGGLKIVVIAGEDAVNVIQQKTATAPIIEVRDRNNLPVAGAVVTFSVEGGKAATFGGASTMSIATNAAGQAAATGFSPIASGAVQINVSAAFQGQTIAATIAQTNVMTAAEAAAAASGASGASSASGSGASGAGAGAGAGGGLSATTIGIAGAAVAGGAVAATQVVKKDEGDRRQRFSAAVTTTLVDTLTRSATGQVCSTTRSIAGSLNLELNMDDPNNFRGQVWLDATVTAMSTTCPGGTLGATFPFGTRADVSGPPSALRGGGTNNYTGTGINGEVITGTQATSFEGSVSGSSATVTLRLDIRSQSPGVNGGSPVEGVGSVTISRTLTKS
jgi:hypothetical protein